METIRRTAENIVHEMNPPPQKDTRKKRGSSNLFSALELFAITHYNKYNYNKYGGADVEYMTAQQAAEKWGISIRWVQVMLKDGRIEGAKRFGNHSWMIPMDAEKPADRRKNNRRRPKKESGI